MKIDPGYVATELEKLFPEAKAELIFHNPFECLCCVMISAQTTDVSVNKVTPALFATYPDAKAMAQADVKDVEDKIRSIGLYRNKAKNLVELAKILVRDYDGEVPNTKEELVKLPGVGIKTANVVGGECFGIPAIAVDTHVARFAKRLGLAPEQATPEEVEAKLEKKFPKELHIKMHHRIIWFGRRICHAQKPECGRCPFTDACLYFKKTSAMTGK